MPTPETSPRVTSARPEMAAAITAETGLNEEVLHDLVHGFYRKVRRDPVLGPIFAARITDWFPHLERMVAIWSSVALMTRRYHGRSVPVHAPLPIGKAISSVVLTSLVRQRARLARTRVPSMSSSAPNASPVHSSSRYRKRRTPPMPLPYSADERMFS